MRKRRDITIKKFKPSDVNAVRNLIQNTIDVCYPSHYNREAIKFFKDYHSKENILKGAKEGYTIVLERNNYIVATGTVIGDLIMRVFVDPEFQKNGFGKLVMQKLEEKALSAGISAVKLDASLPSKKFYDSLGYVTLEETFLEVENGKKLVYYKMEKHYEKLSKRIVVQHKNKAPAHQHHTTG
jgi:GNAT superfamily N-acetyltransferase